VLPLEVRHYVHESGSFELYDDDGESFDYERGEYGWTRLEVARAPSGEWRGSVPGDPRGRKWRYGEVTWRFMTPTP
jgi:alpha-D-xyloside xylohydrolase